MAVISDFEGRFHQSQRHFDAASRLLNAQFFKEATAMYWWSIRDRLFGWLEKRGTPFDSTTTALVAAMSCSELEDISADLSFVYTIGTLAEWDESFTPSNEEASKYKATCEALMPYLKD